jgi:hypothetical protein
MNDEGRGRGMKPDWSRLQGIVAAEVLTALRLADAELTRAGIPHLVIGGLAVCAYGYRRTTDDVDFFVTDEAFEHHGPIVSMRVPVATIGTVRIDQVSFADEPGLQKEVREIYNMWAAEQAAPLRMLVHLKLKANRMRDVTDIVELIKRGAFEDTELDAIEDYLAPRPELLRRWMAAVDRARKESDKP